MNESFIFISVERIRTVVTTVLQTIFQEMKAQKKKNQLTENSPVSKTDAMYHTHCTLYNTFTNT